MTDVNLFMSTPVVQLFIKFPAFQLFLVASSGSNISVSPPGAVSYATNSSVNSDLTPVSCLLFSQIDTGWSIDPVRVEQMYYGKHSEGNIYYG